MRRAARCNRGSPWRGLLLLFGIGASVVAWVNCGADTFPAVWERLLSASGYGRPYLQLLPMPSGDVAVISSTSAVGFFSGRTLPRAETRSLVAVAAGPAYRANLPNGYTVRRIGPPACVYRPGVTVAIEDAQQQLRNEYALLWLLDAPRKLTATECGLTDPPSVMQRVVIIDPKLIALPDNTFLAADAQIGAVVRFDAQFGTRSFLLHRRLFRMPAREMKAMVKAHAQPTDAGGFDWAAFQADLEERVAALAAANTSRQAMP